MFAIVEISGRQFRAETGAQLTVPRQQAEPGAFLLFEKVLLADDGAAVSVGTPVVPNLSVETVVVRHGRGKKVTVFKKKRRKGYQVKNTHRQDFTILKVAGIRGLAPVANTQE